MLFPFSLDKLYLQTDQEGQVKCRLLRLLGVPCQNMVNGASLVAQWLRICLLMQETRVRALVWEDPTCHGATGPVSHNY